jgi:type II secretory ATPase GspE/PulE/Tfp pilus assembly ATPase PilB-like protein
MTRQQVMKPSKTHDVVSVVNEILARGLADGASDIHFEPTDGDMLIRLRLDGVLRDMRTVPGEIADNVIARLKVMAGLLTYRLDIPQEGALSAKLLRPVGANDADLRVATFPTVRGERAVVRALYSDPGIDQLDDLELAGETAALLRCAAAMPSGMILVTGPAGSGKTTTLHAVVRHIVATAPGRSIVALEDPVERRIAGVTQIQIQPHGELDYPRAMRSLLRQDPQVLLVGEIRDAATANIVVEAALTGHLLLSTMHAGDPAEAVVRLREMGIPPYQLVSVLHVILAQRLLRRLCTDCRKATGEPDEPYRHAGCDVCHSTGYRGRIVCAQRLALNDATRSAIRSDAPAAELRTVSQAQGPTLLTEARRLVAGGVTDRAEVERIIGQPLT